LYDGQKSKGAGFVELESHEQVKLAVSKCNGQMVNNKRLMVTVAKH